MDASNILFTETPLGVAWLWSTSQGICGLGFGHSVAADQVRRLARYGVATPLPVSTDLLENARLQLNAYFERKIEAFSLTLDLKGTDFQKVVWGEILQIPYGSTRTYGEIATAVGRPRATRAVGQAVGANPVSIVVACHRVVGARGQLTGYAWGIERKASLLAVEQAGIQLRIPMRWLADNV